MVQHALNYPGTLQWTSGVLSRYALLTGTSVLALVLAASPSAHARQLGGGGQSFSAVTNAAAAAALSAQQAATLTQQSMQSLTRATQALQVMQAVQNAARSAALGASNNVPDGLGAGGLQVAPGVGTDPTLWQNANLPTQSTGNGQTTVTIQQTAQKAILTWTTFNVGKNTTAYFNQSAGTAADGSNNWVVLNRVTDPSGVPSQILGQIKAEGSVYLINRNGIMFGGSSQVNVNTFIASSLNLFSNDPATSNNRFLTGGIGDLNATNFATNSILLTTNTPGAGEVTIAPGAAISVGTQGLALIAAPEVTNGGVISAPSGQVALIAGIGVSYDYNKSSFGGIANSALLPGSNDNSTTNLRFANYGKLTDLHGNDITPVGTLTNNGVIYTPRGNITLLGGAVQQNGVAIATTSVAQPGSIVIESFYEAGNYLGTANFYTGSISFGPQAVTAILADSNGVTLSSDTTSLAPFQTLAAVGNFTTPLPTQGPGKIQIIGQAIDFQGGTLVYAPGQTLSASTVVLPDPRTSVPPVAGSGRILLESGAILDVSGIPGTVLTVADNLLTVKLAGNELADSPLQQNSFLFGQTITVDMGASGVNAETGESWVGTPLANLASYANLVQRSIGQLLVNGGLISLSANEVIGVPGSIINVMGGYVDYKGGIVQTTVLIGADGRKYRVGSADPDMTYIAIAGQFTVDHAHWGITDVYSDPLIGGGYYQPEYIQGGNAGTIGINVIATNGFVSSTPYVSPIIAGSGAFVLQSTILADAFAGQRQVAGGALPSNGSFGFTGILPVEIGDPSVLSASSLAATSLPANFNMAAPLLATSGSPYAAANIFNSQALSDIDFAQITVNTGTQVSTPHAPIVVDAGSALAVQTGGSINLTGSTVTVVGALTARAGAISITTTSSNSGSVGTEVAGDLVVGSGAVLDVSGLFVNDALLPPDQQGQPVAVNAGSISLVTNAAVLTKLVGGLEIPIGDFTGNITLADGSLLDLRGGGHVLSNGRLQSDSKGVPLGSGGNLSLVTYQGLIAPPTADGSHPQGGQLALNGVIDALGFNGGGSLTLQTVAFQIGGDAAKTPSYSFYFDPTLWGERGFASFNLSSVQESEVPAGAIVRLTHDNLLPDLTAIVSAANGADPSAYATAGFLTGTLLSPTNLSVTAGLEENGNGFGLPSAGSDYAQVDPGAQILGNPGATISIASYTMTNIFGAISAPGGSISLAVTSPSNPGGPLGPLYLGPQSVLDVSGTTVINPLAKPVATRNGLVVPYTGQILPGGTINLSDDLSPILVAPGAILNVSGAAGAFDVAQLASGGSLGGQQLVLVRQPVWSDAGRVNIAGATDLLFEGTLIGNPGAAQAAGATLSITGDALANGGPAGTIVLINDVADAFAASSQPINFNFATYVPSASKALQGIANLGAGRLLLGADRINGSGFSSLVLSADSVVFAGTVALDLPASFIATARLYIGSNAGNFGSLALPGGATPTTDGASLTVNAPYISISGVSNPSLGNIPASSDATLTLNAAQIDISAFATLYNIGQANFNSSGDIRLLPQQSMAGVTQLLGGLWSNGSLAFKAADIYPATDTAFVIEAIPRSGGPSTTVTFAYPVGAGPSTGTPLSAGGALLVDATNIIQNGEIQAPFGSIILGISSTGSISGALGLTAGGINNYFPSSLATQSVTLGSGSITSVSANGQVIPYGSTVDQTTWIYNPQINNPSWAGATTSTLFASPLTSAPQGVVTLTGTSVAFNRGATINLSGGGDLQAQEWIPGTGGSRDVLSQINTSYANSTAGTQVPLYADNRQIYAILPGYNSKVAPYDATLSQVGLSAGQSVYLAGGPGLAAGYYTLLPAKYATLPGAFRVVVNSGVTNPLSNQTVTLPDGTMEIEGYFSNSIAGTRTASTAQFFVQSASTWGRYSQYALTSANSFFPTYASQNNLAAPNIPIDAGRLALTAVTGLTLGGTLLGSPAAGGTGGQVDISAQYIDIVDSLTPGGATTTTIGGNSYVLVSAADLSALNATSLLIGGTRTLTTAGTVITPTANGVQVSNDAADPLSAPEIMLVAAPLFQNFTIRLDNDGDSATIKVPVASTGQVVFNAGSVVQATGSGAGVGQNRLILGSTLATLPTLPSSLLVSDIQAGNSSNAGALLIANYYAALDAALGTLVRVSNGDPVTVQLPSLAQINPNPAQNTPGSTPGQIPVTDNINAANPVYNIVLPWLSGAASGTGAVIQSGATISAGNSLTLATTGDVRVASGAQVSAKNIAARSSSITFLGSGTDPGAGLVIDAGLQAALQQATSVNLQSYGAIQFLGNVNIAMTNAQGSLTLGGGSLSSDGGQVTIAAPTLVLDNELGAAVPGVLATGAGSLSINAGELVFGDGAKSLTGFGSVSLVAQQGVLGQGTGTMNFGSLPVTLQTPIVIADTGSSQTLTTTGALSVLAAAGPAMTSAGLGGAITLQGGSVTVAAPIQALAGNITLQASAGDVTVTAGGSLIAHGVAKQFFDVVEYASAGSITLTADHGTVNIQSGAVVDFAGASLGGNGGGLTITTTNSSTPVALDGTLLGSTAAGYNGSIFGLTTGAAANLDSLAQILTGAGVTGGIGVHTGQGDLTLSQGNSLIASQVALVADGGSVVVNGVIDASGSAGGTIQLYGTGTVTGTNVAAGTGVIVNGSLLARASDPSQLGGTVEIGTSGHFDPVNGTYNTNYGYESVAAANSGTITIGANALIDVSGGAVGGLTGGTVLLRAPLLADGSVNVHINLTNPSQQIVGARSVTLESYAVWSTTDNATTTGAAKHFDGIVDPAGWYDGSGHLLSGTFTDASGATVLSYTAGTMTAAQLATYLANDYFTPTAANTDATRTAHENFYGYVNGDDTTGAPGTLMGFIQSPGFQPVAGIAGIAHFQPVVGIELDNPSATVNSGGIAVLSNWNLGAQDASGNPVFRYNYQGTLLAPHLTLRAVGGVSIKASITDGFYQNGALRAATPPVTGSGFGFVTYNTAAADYANLYANDSLTLFIPVYGYDFGDFTTIFNQNIASWDLHPPQPFGSFGLSSGAIGNGYYGAYEQYFTQWENYSFAFPVVASSSGTTQPTTITTELNAAEALYNSTNINAYAAYIAAYATYINDYTNWAARVQIGGTLPLPPSLPPVVSLPPPSIPTASGPNSPNVVNNANNGAAIAGMALASQASSTSYRIVAGANLQSANPLALNAAGSGDVTIDGHTTFGVVNGTTVEIVIPTIVRTGTGSIDIAAAGNFALLDPLAPGVVYTAGTPVQPAVGGDSASVALGAGISTTPSGNINVATNIGISTLLTSQVNPEDAGNITINVLGNIIGIENVRDTVATNTLPLSAPPSGLTSGAGTFIGQFWSAWLLANPSNPSVPWYVNFGSFDQGIMSIGGNVTVKAGGDIHDLAVSLPTTAYLDGSKALHVIGGGNLSVTAGGSIYSGDFYVGEGRGTIRAGGAITSDFTYGGSLPYPVQTLLAVQYATIDVEARQSADIGGVYDPTYLWAPNMFYGGGSPPVASYQMVGGTPTLIANLMPYVTSMSTGSGVSVQSTGGAVTFNSLLVQAGLFSLGASTGAINVATGEVDAAAGITSLLLPASLDLVALDGGITIDHGGGLYPSATGTLSLVADQSITLAIPAINGVDQNGKPENGVLAFTSVGNVFGNALGKLDDPVGTGILPTGASPGLVNVALLSPVQTHDPALISSGPTDPVQIYALNGSIVDGLQTTGVARDAGNPGKFANAGGTLDQISLIPNAPAQIEAGLDILDLPFFGENFSASDITSLIAGRDIRSNIFGTVQPAAIELAGPGNLLVEAGRDIAFPSQRVSGTTIESGIRTIGNSIDTITNPYNVFISSILTNTSNFQVDFGNPYLPTGGASATVLFGVGPGMDIPAFIAQYIDPATANSFALSTITWRMLDALGNPTGPVLTPQQFWPMFETLAPAQQRLDVERALFAVLDATGKNYNNPSSPNFHQYATGYQAINTLFPAGFGYTANNLEGGTNGANQLVHTGDLDLRGSTIQTQQGGNVSILGPGGRVLVGSSLASPSTNPGSEGILTLEKGSIDIFVDQDVLVAQSRVMTEQGGNILMWSSNGDLDAGKGAKTSVSAPPPKYSCDVDWICAADIKGAVSGAGIATLQSLPNVPVGDANLVAPRGTIDFGAAGVRTSGNLNVAALQYLNTFNVQVQGTTTGIPTVPAPNVGALTTASNATAATQQAATPTQSGQSDRPSIIIVEVLGYGGGSSDTPDKSDEERGKRPQDQRSYNPDGAVQVLGHGNLNDEEKQLLNEDEKRKL